MTRSRSPNQASAPGQPIFIGERLWLDFANIGAVTGGRVAAAGVSPADALDRFEGFVGWLVAARVLDDERADALLKRAQQQPTGASAALHEVRRMRTVLRALAERAGAPAERATQLAISEINRILGRSAGSRRVEPRVGGGFVRSFVTVGDVFAGLLIPIIESAADSLVAGDMPRVRVCGDAHCTRVFYDGSRNRKRRWCEMTSCGNRAKATRHRRRRRPD